MFQVFSTTFLFRFSINVFDMTLHYFTLVSTCDKQFASLSLPDSIFRCEEKRKIVKAIEQFSIFHFVEPQPKLSRQTFESILFSTHTHTHTLAQVMYYKTEFTSCLLALMSSNRSSWQKLPELFKNHAKCLKAFSAENSRIDSI